ncbi:MAG: PaaI family thioesterase [Verrucomicrobia bacterium]|nr:PaaI family thioesterase [Verrucomicrobiota bacterium]
MTKQDSAETARQNFQALLKLLPKTAAAHLGIEVAEVDAAHIVLTMPITDAARQPMGLLHGGVSMVLAETAASMHACWGLDLTKTVPVGIEINGSHLRSAASGRVRAVGTVVSRGRSLVVHEVRISHEETGRLLSVGRVTNFFKPVVAVADSGGSSEK